MKRFLLLISVLVFSPCIGFAIEKAGSIINGPLPLMMFAYIPPGEFLMGSPLSEEGRLDVEEQHHVRINKGFYMQTTEVTQGQWKAVMGNNPSEFKGCGDNCPVDNVSWEDANEFIIALNKMKKGIFRLPTEEEWEYACRAGSSEAVYGNKDDIAWYNNNSNKTTHPVMTKRPNDWNLYDMIGNVCEWCSDDYDYYPKENTTNRTASSLDHMRVVQRGGSWFCDTRICRAAHRGNFSPVFKFNDFGFRLVMDQANKTL
ncbi:formylglycine-generating enzyme family protein [Desulforegula conservatrix]|uniref:formylglycine-generating enzyme family protein n=1 Tax=Desulforegula conservatrix TaxID=153026 RepID=UPI000417D11F|nr:formylglycine-generating enzyme family protein [Desulforegula conservatrix]